ncbi:hypothetical protein LCGC14_0626030 [marine sediment metagenome]|uniref:Tip attachment protein J domain-containing protein n=1 Tax=marine sediment metagenome TaxID=412755 RepID=A0A0F9UBT7_9ZZZZ
MVAKPLSEYGTRQRRFRREQADRLGLLSKPANIIAPDLALPVIYGRALVNGRLAFAHKPANTNVTHMIMVYSCHQINAFEDVLYSGRTLSRDDSGQVADIDEIYGWVDVFEHLGSESQPADTRLINEVGTEFWTTAHRLRGLSYLYYQSSLIEAKFPTDEPEAMQALIQGAIVFDTRTSSSAYSTNSVPCIYDLLTNTKYGFGEPTASISVASFDQAANDCDTQGFTVGGIIGTELNPYDMLDKLLDTCAGTLQRVNGLWTLKVGIWEAPTITLGEDDLIVSTDLRIRPKIASDSKVNGMRGVFVEPDREWQELDIPPIENAAFVTEDNGIEHLGDKSLLLVTDVNQAQHLLSIELLKGRQQITLSGSYKLVALQIRAGDVMLINYTRNGVAFSVKSFLVETLIVKLEEGKFLVELDLKETSEAVFTAPSFTSLPTLPEILLQIKEILNVRRVDEDGEEPLKEAPVGTLELVNATEPNGIEFTDDDAIFSWRMVSAGTSEEFGNESSGAGTGWPSPDFRDFRVRIYDEDEETVRREHFSPDDNFIYTLEANQDDGVNGEPATDFFIDVQIRTYSGGRDSNSVRHGASNPSLGKAEFFVVEVDGDYEWDAGANPKLVVILSGNSTITDVINAKEGGTLILYVYQLADTSYTLDTSVMEWPGGNPPTITTGTDAKDIVTGLTRGGIPSFVHQGGFS